MAWHGSNDFAEKAPSVPVEKSPRPLAEVREYTRLALIVSPWNDVYVVPVNLYFGL